MSAYCAAGNSSEEWNIIWVHGSDLFEPNVRVIDPPGTILESGGSVDRVLFHSNAASAVDAINELCKYMQLIGRLRDCSLYGST
jgi:hypothetical protein